MSVIFVTLKDGEYNDYWLSNPETMLIPSGCAGYVSERKLRMMHWCGQRSGKKDHLVQPGTFVAVRDNTKVLAFTLVGVVNTKTMLKEGKPATYRLRVDLWETPRTIPRAEGDLHTHWAVLRELGINHVVTAMPEGIYGSQKTDSLVLEQDLLFPEQNEHEPSYSQQAYVA